MPGSTPHTANRSGRASQAPGRALASMGCRSTAGREPRTPAPSQRDSGRQRSAARHRITRPEATHLCPCSRTFLPSGSPAAAVAAQAQTVNRSPRQRRKRRASSAATTRCWRRPASRVRSPALRPASRFEETPLADVVSLILREMPRWTMSSIRRSTAPSRWSHAARCRPTRPCFLLEAALQANGLLMVRDARGTYHVGRPEALKGIVAAPRQAGNGPLPPGYGAIVVPLKYIGAARNGHASCGPMAPAEAHACASTPCATCWCWPAPAAQAEGLARHRFHLRRRPAQGHVGGCVPAEVRHHGEVEAALRMMSAAGSTGRRPAAPAGASTAASPGARPGRPARAASDFPLFGAMRVMPIERLNSVLVVTPTAAYLDEARRWIERLDRPGNNSAEAQLHRLPGAKRLGQAPGRRAQRHLRQAGAHRPARPRAAAWRRACSQTEPRRHHRRDSAPQEERPASPRARAGLGAPGTRTSGQRR